MMNKNIIKLCFLLQIAYGSAAMASSIALDFNQKLPVAHNALHTEAQLQAASIKVATASDIEVESSFANIEDEKDTKTARAQTPESKRLPETFPLLATAIIIVSVATRRR